MFLRKLLLQIVARTFLELFRLLSSRYKNSSEPSPIPSRAVAMDIMDASWMAHAYDFATAERRAADEPKERLPLPQPGARIFDGRATRICGLLKNSFFCCGVSNAETPPSSPADWYYAVPQIDDEEVLLPRPSPLSKDLVSTQHELALVKQEAWQRSPTSVCAPSSYADTPPPLDRTMRMVRARSESSTPEPTLASKLLSRSFPLYPFSIRRSRPRPLLALPLFSRHAFFSSLLKHRPYDMGPMASASTEHHPRAGETRSKLGSVASCFQALRKAGPSRKGCC